MNENEAKLVKALRSGKFNQGKKTLRSDTNVFCCMGVACEIYRLEHLETSKWVNLKMFKVLNENYFELIKLPTAVQKWLGWSSPIGELKNCRNLVDLNDSGTTFKEIAKLIENNLVVKGVDEDYE
ncbi:MAG: hypothetical protein NVS3B3_09330 [Aquirhabdus sp.]